MTRPDRTPRPEPTDAVRHDRAAGVVIASAAADALGAPHEFGPSLPADRALAMTGGGSFGWEPGEWTDDTQQALLVLAPLATGTTDPRPAIEAGLLAWYRSHPRDVGTQTRAVMGGAERTGTGLADAAAAHQARNPDAAGNGSLMRTGPVGLIHLAGCSLDDVAELAAAVSALTHPHPDAVDACVLWSVAIAQALNLPAGTAPDWVGLVAAGLDPHVPAERRAVWRTRLDACRDGAPEDFTGNGWVVTALQTALAAIATTTVPDGLPAATHLRLAVERAVRAGGDTDTVAAIAGSLLGAFWGATAVPFDWRRPLHGRATYATDDPVRRLADLDRDARLAVTGGMTDRHRWPGIDRLLPHYLARFADTGRAHELAPGLRVGGVHALPTVLADGVDAVVSLCRIGTDDVPTPVEHHVIGLIDSDAADNPNVHLVLADTADLVAALLAEDRRVFLHCVQAEHRTPAVAATYLMRHHRDDPASALERIESLLGSRPTPFLEGAVHGVGRLADPLSGRRGPPQS